MAMRCCLLHFQWDGAHVPPSQPLPNQLNTRRHDAHAAAESPPVLPGLSLHAAGTGDATVTLGGYTYLCTPSVRGNRRDSSGAGVSHDPFACCSETGALQILIALPSSTFQPPKQKENNTEKKEMGYQGCGEHPLLFKDLRNLLTHS